METLIQRAGLVLNERGTTTAGAMYDSEGRRIYRALAYDTTAIDLHGTTIVNSAFREVDLSNLPVILFHDGERFPVGKIVEWLVGENGPVAGIVFADTQEAREAELLVSTGFLNGVSIGFIGWKSEKIDKVLTYTDVEVLELSLTPTPSSRTALINLERSIQSLKAVDETIEEITVEEIVEPVAIEETADVEVVIEQAATVTDDGNRQRLQSLLYRLR